jgi:hypothetical protein
MGRQHQGHHHHGEPEVLPRETETGKGIGSKGTKDDIGYDTKGANDKGVFKKSTEADNTDPFPALEIIL